MDKAYSSVILEKIGDLNYMFNWYPWSAIVCDDNYSLGLRCYQDPDFGPYSTGIADSCNETKILDKVSQYSTPPAYRVYPNPTWGTVQLTVSDPGKTMVKVTDIVGRTLLTREFENAVQIDLGPYPNGMYFFTIFQNQHMQGVERILKK